MKMFLAVLAAVVIFAGQSMANESEQHKSGCCCKQKQHTWGKHRGGCWGQGMHSWGMHKHRGSHSWGMHKHRGSHSWGMHKHGMNRHAWGMHKHGKKGKITEVTASSLTLKTHGKTKAVKITENTKVIVNHKAATAADLRAGMTVTVRHGTIFARTKKSKTTA